MTVYLCALLPAPGLSFDAQRRNTATGFHPSEPAVGNADGSTSWPRDGAIEVFYQDCDPAVAGDAAGRLRRQFWRVTQEVTPLLEWPAVRSAYILCLQDRIISSEYSRHVSREMLGVEAIEVAGGHSPFLAQPRELATLLERVSAAEPEGASG
jgi:hypothetical protein